MPRRLGSPAVRDGLALTLLALALAFWQRPGEATSDTKIDLHVDPVGFLADVAAVWSPTGDLGHVHAGQYAGYLFPMGPFFAAGHLAGLAPWVVHRLWLAAVLAVALWGTLRLVDALLPAGGRPARLTAAALVLLNPYVVVFVNRTSITLLAYALLPWMLLAVHRGLRDRGWWWAGALALIVASAGGGVNVAVLAWLLLAPLGLLIYEPAAGLVSRGAARAFALRAAACLAVASVWWVAPVAAHVLYGRDFLPFTEQPGVIWGTTSASEALRLMGYWTSYLGVGYSGALRPYTSDAGVMLFQPLVVVASLLVPALVVAGLLAARRWIYAPFCVLLALAGTLIVTAGFPEGTPLRRIGLFAYFHAGALQFLRTTYKAAPLLVVAFALLAAAAAAALWPRLRGFPVRAAVVAAGVTVLALAAWPLVRGQAIDSQLAWRQIPPAWKEAARDLDAEPAPNSRALVVPGELFAFARWGGTVDPLLPALTSRPVAERGVVPYADRRAVDALWTVDGLLQEERLAPGELRPLLSWLGVGSLALARDSDRARSGAAPPASVARQLAELGRPARAYGDRRRAPGETGTLDPARRLARVTRFDLAGGRGLVRVQPRDGGLVVDGSAATVAGLAAFGALGADPAVTYAADRSAAELRDAAARGAEVVIGDSNRRRVIVPSRMRQGVGATLTAAEDPPPDAAVLDPFPELGAAAQTVAVYDGIRDVREDPLPAVTQFPEHRPFAALDGRTDTSWIAPDHVDQARHWIEVDLAAPRDVPYVDVLPHADARGRPTELEAAGRRFPVHAGWNRLRLGLRDVRRLRVLVAEVDKAPGVDRVPGGLAELRLPGVHAREWLRPPVLAERALRGADLRRSALTYVFERTTGATPFRRSPLSGPPQARLTRDRGDAERQLARRITPPAARRFGADAWVTVAPDAPDPRLDALAGTRGGRFASSGRFEGPPGRRASRAFDGRPGTAWVAPWLPGHDAWLEWRTRRPRTLEALTLRAPAARLRRPARVRLVADGSATAPLAVAANGRVALRAPVRGRTFRLEVLDAAFPAGTSGRARQRRAVAVAEVEGAGARARDGRPRIAAECGALTVLAGGGRLGLRPAGSTAAFDRGAPLRARSCTPPLALGEATVDLQTASEDWRPYWLRLRSPAPAAGAAAAPPGRIADAGRLGRASVDGVRLALDRPGRLVLGESYDPGWRLSCDGRGLGRPRPADGWANGWLVPAGCTRAAFTYAPDRPVRLAMLLSGLLCLAGFVALVARRPPAPADGPAARELDPRPADAPGRLAWRRAALLGLGAGAAAAVVIALRAGPVVAVLVALVARYGIGARPLIVAAAALLGVAVPVVYLLFTPEDLGGYSFSYAGDIVGAHWLAVTALVLLALALWRTLSTARGRGAGRRRSPP